MSGNQHLTAQCSAAPLLSMSIAGGAHTGGVAAGPPGLPASGRRHRRTV
ncbi:hypothetical protein BZL29_5433 [Mycobacterium kansasii]|uniref:Uncharacterized protein n=1 Tax=Mycobacterium kansasii TaxID=1768 RepID=A0A1V3WWU4_MYCKA|nr:hypothetical protein BZL29_5433 [Mycobacterium kansasii]